ncbi:MAG TPA: NIPSNAP family protein [Bryobacteraceae bacterium]|nr:NIPSNAP family protein [Bryobacteraceae bacterium]
MPLRTFLPVSLSLSALMSAGALLLTTAVHAQSGRVFELRTYTTYDGKLDALKARFRNHTMRIFEKHGMTNVGYWVPQDAPQSGNTLIYIISHASREQAKKNWDAFRADPEWQKVQKESEAHGKIVSKVESVFMDAADFSPLK